jgi:hypothetical protein
MNNNKIKCPKCGTQISIDQEAIILRVREQIKAEAKKEEEIRWNEREKELNAQKDEELKEEKQKRILAEQNELKLRKRQEELEDKEKNIDLIISRKVENQTNQKIEKMSEEKDEKHALENAEKEKKISDLLKALDEAKRKGVQGSMQAQGEVLELAIEDMLKKNFYSDRIEEIKKGAMGADIIQKVIHSSGQIAGMILWETKRTKGWEDKWVEKLKDDGRNIKADACVLVSDNLPKGVKNIDQYLGVIVCNTSSALGVSSIIRKGLLSNFNTVLVNTNKDEKQAAVYDYLCSPSFKQVVDVINENSKKLLEIQEAEKRWMTKKWTQEEMRVRRLQENALRMVGDIQGIIDLPEIRMTEELPKLEEKIDKKTDDSKNKTEEDSNQANLF